MRNPLTLDPDMLPVIRKTPSNVPNLYPESYLRLSMVAIALAAPKGLLSLSDPRVDSRSTRPDPLHSDHERDQLDRSQSSHRSPSTKITSPGRSSVPSTPGWSLTGNPSTLKTSDRKKKTYLRQLLRQPHREGSIMFLAILTSPSSGRSLMVTRCSRSPGRSLSIPAKQDPMTAGLRSTGLSTAIDGPYGPGMERVNGNCVLRTVL